MKKILSFVLAAMMLLSVTAFQAFAAQDGSIGDSITWTLSDDGDLVIEGTGAIPDGAESPWIDYALDIYTLTVGDGITSVGSYAFRGLESVFEVSLADSVTELGYGAFADCTSMDYIELGSSVKTLGREAFSGCTALEEVAGADGLECVGVDAFKNTKLVNKADNGVVYVGSAAVAYKGAPSVGTELVIQDGTACIADGTFKNQGSIARVTFPDSLVHIGDDAFSGCSGLTEPAFPKGLVYIGENAFYACTSVKSATLYESIDYIGKMAFGWYKDPAWGSKKDAEFTVNGYAGTAAETYALDSENGFKFVDITPPAPLYKKGDANLNGRLDANDILVIKRHAANIEELSPDAFAAADVDGNGQLNAMDILMIKRAAAGIIEL